jgi:hypothetical protein
MACNVLPRLDKQICLFERWLIVHLDTIGDSDHRQLIQRFATWEVLPRLRARAGNKPITPSSRRFAGEQTKQATVFLDWLAQRQRVLRTCDQANIDTWHAEHSEHLRRCLCGFLLWSMDSNLVRPLRLPTLTISRNPPLPQRERMALLGRLLTGHDLPLRSRVAGTIVLLYAQRLSRIVRLTIDVIHDGEQVLLRLGEPPSPVPAPFAQLLLAWINERDNMNTATNPNSRWLIPGRRAGQPMHPASLAAQGSRLEQVSAPEWSVGSLVPVPALSASDPTQSLHEMGLAGRPLGGDNGVHGRVTKSVLLTGSPGHRPAAQDSLEPHAKGVEGTSGPLVAGVGLEVNPDYPKRLEGVPQQKKLGFGVDTRALR